MLFYSGGGEGRRGAIDTLAGSSGQALARQYRKEQDETHSLLWSLQLLDAEAPSVFLCEPLGCCHLQMKDSVMWENNVAPNSLPPSLPASLRTDEDADVGWEVSLQPQWHLLQ